MEEIIKMEDSIYELDQTTATLGFIQTAFAEGESSINMKEAGDALYLLYLRQGEALKRIHDIIGK